MFDVTPDGILLGFTFGFIIAGYLFTWMAIRDWKRFDARLEATRKEVK